MNAAEDNTQSADEHVATAATQTAAAQAEVRTAIPLTIPPATGHLRTADGQLTKALIELPAARADLKAAQEKLATVRDELAAAIARGDKWEAKYKGQWLAGKSWAVIWTLIIGASILLIGVLLLNFYTDVFVVPLAHIGKWLADIVAGTVKAFWNVCAGIGAELASLFKRKAAPVVKN